MLTRDFPLTLAWSKFPFVDMKGVEGEALRIYLTVAWVPCQYSDALLITNTHTCDFISLCFVISIEVVNLFSYGDHSRRSVIPVR